MKEKKCKICTEKFTPTRPLQMVCTPTCGYIYARRQQEKNWQREKKVRKEKIMTRSEWVKLTQEVVNRYIRKRDERQPCISCGKHINGVRHASHYRSAFGHSNIRFHEDNIWVSCYKCNVMLSGNEIEYRKRLISKIGLERVEWLENNSLIEKKWSLDELELIREVYKKKIVELNKK